MRWRMASKVTVRDFFPHFFPFLILEIFFNADVHYFFKLRLFPKMAREEDFCCRQQKKQPKKQKKPAQNLSLANLLMWKQVKVKKLKDPPLHKKSGFLDLTMPAKPPS